MTTIIIIGLVLICIGLGLALSAASHNVRRLRTELEAKEGELEYALRHGKRPPNRRKPVIIPYGL